MIRIATKTLGCKINQAESAIILDQFPKDTIQTVDWEQDADIYIVNTCTVTNRTDYKSRYHIRQALAKKALNPLAKVVVTGCFAQRGSEEVRELGDVDFIVDNQHKLSIAEILSGKEIAFTDIMSAEEFSYKPSTHMAGHSRAFQKIQDGCDFYCSYCAVPYARGHARSAKFSQVLEQARLFAEVGFKEIVLGGVNLGLYRDGEKGLAEVVEAMAEINGLELIRLSSIEPQLFSSELITKLQAIPKLCPHFHIPLQSGSDAVLQRMGRRYDTALVQRLVGDILQAFPYAAIGFDVITGFPGETDAEHQETYTFLTSLPLAYLHVFTYSKRKGTPADKMPNQVPKDTKHARTVQLSRLSETLCSRYEAILREKRITVRGIVEQSSTEGSEILSDHYLRVSSPQTHELGSCISVSLS